MRRKLGNIDRADDATCKHFAKRINSLMRERRVGSQAVLQAASTGPEQQALGHAKASAPQLELTAQLGVLSWALGRRLDLDFFEKSARHLNLYVGTVESARACIDEVAHVAGQAGRHSSEESEPWEPQECVWR